MWKERKTEKKAVGCVIESDMKRASVSVADPK